MIQNRVTKFGWEMKKTEDPVRDDDMSFAGSADDDDVVVVPGKATDTIRIHLKLPLLTLS